MDSSAFDEQSASVIKLNNSTVLFLKEVSAVQCSAVQCSAVHCAVQCKCSYVHMKFPKTLRPASMILKRVTNKRRYCHTEDDI